MYIKLPYLLFTIAKFANLSQLATYALKIVTWIADTCNTDIIIIFLPSPFDNM